MNTKMIITDLDRTLLTKDKRITDYSKEIFEQCSNKGIKIAIATARPVRSSINYLNELKGDAAVYLNGALVNAGGKTIQSYPIDYSDTRSILSKIKKKFPATTLSVESQGVLYTDFKADMPWEYRYIDFNNLPRQPADKIIIGSIDIDKYKDIAKLLPEYVYAEKNSDKFIMIMNKMATKHNGVMNLSEHFGIDLVDIVAFGDDYNDVGMLKVCGKGIAMSAACDKAKESADFITGTYDEDGVASFISKYILG